MMRFLYYTRVGQHKYYNKVFNETDVLKGADKYFVTEFLEQYEEYRDEQKIYHLDIKKNIQNKFSSYYFTPDEIIDIIERGRLLRNIPHKQAINYIDSVTTQLVELFEKVEPDLVASHISDGFSVSIFHRIALKKGIPTFSPVANGWGDTTKFYKHRRIIERPDPLDCKVGLREALAEKKGNPLNPSISKFDLLKRLRDYYGAKKDLKFNKKISGFDHGKSTTHLEFRLKETTALPKLNFRDLLPGYYDDFDNLTLSNDKPIVYISCHYVPEATLDYFVEDLTLIDHDNIILQLLHKYHDDVQFIVKEHPVMYNKRDLSFYDAIKKIPSCYLIHPSVLYYKVFEKVDAVVSWGGTAGIEAPFFNTKTLNIDKPFYHVEGYENYFTDRRDLMNNFYHKLMSLNYSDEEYFTDIENRLRYLLFKGNMHDTRGNYKKNISILGNSINYLIEDILYKDLDERVLQI